jgi:hypothetical protein
MILSHKLVHRRPAVLHRGAIQPKVEEWTEKPITINALKIARIFIHRLFHHRAPGEQREFFELSHFEHGHARRDFGPVEH